jgi:hypothetical protein
VRTRDPLGIITFILGLLGFLVITVPIALILGVAALARIRRTGRQGRGMAVAGLTLAVLWGAAGAGFAALVVTATDEGPKRNPQGEIESPASVRPDDLKPGDCVTGVKVGDVGEIRAVKCGEPGASTVFAVFELKEQPWPSEVTIDALASDGCTDRYKAPSDKPNKEPDVIFVRPTENSWKIGDRTVLCVATPAK